MKAMVFSFISQCMGYGFTGDSSAVALRAWISQRKSVSESPSTRVREARVRQQNCFIETEAAATCSGLAGRSVHVEGASLAYGR